MSIVGADLSAKDASLQWEGKRDPHPKDTQEQSSADVVRVITRRQLVFRKMHQSLILSFWR